MNIVKQNEAQLHGMIIALLCEISEQRFVWLTLQDYRYFN